DPSTALAEARRGVSALQSKRSAKDWENFEVSRGISWGPRESQRRIADLVGGNAKSLVVSLANDDSKGWVRLVRQSPPINELAAIRHTASGLSTFVSEE